MSTADSSTHISGTATFKQQERNGWNAKAGDYGQYGGCITRNAVDALLAAVGVQENSKHLDVACGPGYVAAAAGAKGASSMGVDIAPAMVAEARKNYPDITFSEADAEALHFVDNDFDAVTCAFGLLHMAEPDQAIVEAFRVLKPGGRYAFTVWALQDHEFFNLVLDAIETHGTLDVPLPPAPPIFRFADHAECERTLAAAGFEDIRVQTLPLVWRPASASALLDFLDKSSVRTALIIEMQEPDARNKIRQAIFDGAERFRTGDVLQLAWPAVLAEGMKPVIK